MKKTTFIIYTLLLLCLTQSPAQIGRLALSPLQTLKQTIAKTDITLTYSRPAMRERKIFGGLVPYDVKWRTGANRNSKIEFSEAVMIGDSLIKKGTYALITKPTLNAWDIYLYDDLTHWDVPEEWDETKVVAHTKVASSKLADDVQSMTLSLDNMTNDKVDLCLSWEKTKVCIPIILTTEMQMNETIADVLGGPSSGDYYLATLYKYQSKKELDQAIIWIDKAIELRTEQKPWDYALKAQILLAQGNKKEAKKSATTALQLAKERPSEYYINLMTTFLEELKE